MNWEDFLRTSSDFKQNRQLVKSNFSKLGPIPPTFRLLIWSEMIPQMQEIPFGIESLFTHLQIKVKKSKVQCLFSYLHSLFRGQLNQIEKDLRSEGDDQDLQLFKTKFMNVCMYLVETFYGEGQIIKKFLMNELQMMDKYKSSLIEYFISDTIENFFMDFGQQSQGIILNIFDNFFLFGLEFICLFVKQLVQDFGIIFDRQSQEMEEEIKKTNKSIPYLIQGQLDIVNSEIFNISIEDPQLIDKNIIQIQTIILSQHQPPTAIKKQVQISNSKQIITNSQQKPHRQSPSRQSSKSSAMKNSVKTRKIQTKQDELETTGTFNTAVDIRKNISPNRSKIVSRKNSSSLLSQGNQEYSTPQKVKIQESKSPLSSNHTTAQRNDDFNIEISKLTQRFGHQRVEQYFCRNKNTQITRLKEQVLDVQKRAIEMGRICQDLLYVIEGFNEKEN